MKTIFTYFKPYKWQSLLGPLFKLFEATFELLVPIVVGLIVDKGLGARINGGYPNADEGYIALLCGVLAVFGLLGLLFSVIAQYFAARTATGVSAGLRRDLFKKIQSLSYKDIDKLGTATLLTRMTSDVDRLQSGVNLALRLFLRSPFIVFGAVVTACIIDPSSFGVFAITVVALAIVVYAIMFACMPLYKKSQAKLDAALLSTRENLSGARVVRALCKEDEERELFFKRNDELNKSRKFVGAIAAITNPLTYVFVNLGVIALLWTGAIRVDSGNLTQGEVLALYNLMSQILVELIKLANLIVTVTKAAACGSRIEGILKTQPSLQDPASEELPNDSAYAVSFENVTLRYNDESDPALENVTFAVKKGETVGVIGGTGSGKTTLVNLLPRFYDATEGRVLVNGVDVKNRKADSLRSSIGVVPQKALLFKGTIRENLSWGKSNATDEELFAALELARAKDFVLEKGGLDSPVEQGGKNFSGGQKQRLTIARALVRNPEILILDDSSSALDYVTDAELRQGVKTLFATTFIVSQRVASVCHADKIAVLDEGKLVGLGSHGELVQSCEVYQEICRSQAKTGGVV